MGKILRVPEDIFLVLMSLSGGVFQAFANLAQTPIPLEIVGCLAQTLGSTGNWLSTKASHLSSDHQFWFLVRRINPLCHRLSQGFSSTVIYLVVTACCLYSIAVSHELSCFSSCARWLAAVNCTFKGLEERERLTKTGNCKRWTSQNTPSVAHQLCRRIFLAEV